MPADAAAKALDLSEKIYQRGMLVRSGLPYHQTSEYFGNQDMRAASIFLAIVLANDCLAGDAGPCAKVDAAELEAAALNEVVFSEAKNSRHKLLLERCMQENAVCVIGFPPTDRLWSKPVPAAPDDKDFDAVNDDISVGLIQYVDRESGAEICLLSRNQFVHAEPWRLYGWIITAQEIRKYDLASERFTIAMTPGTLYQAMLDAHREAITHN